MKKVRKITNQIKILFLWVDSDGPPYTSDEYLEFVVHHAFLDVWQSNRMIVECLSSNTYVHSTTSFSRLTASQSSQIAKIT